MQMSKFGGLTVAMVVALVASLVPAMAMAAPTVALPTAEVLGHITLVTAFIVAIGGAVLGLIYLARAFGWAKKAG